MNERPGGEDGASPRPPPGPDGLDRGVASPARPAVAEEVAHGHALDRPGKRIRVAGGQVSVAMATYNGARYVAEQLRSIVSQTLPPTEVVICDDRSTDDTAAVVKAFARTSPVPIRFHPNPERLGFGDNFLKAASLTVAPFIAFSDQDDVWHADKLERSLAAMREHDAVMAAHSARLIDGDGRVLGLMQPDKRSRAVPPCTLDPWRIFWGLSQTFDRRLLDLLPNDGRTRGADSNAPNRCAGHDEWTTFLAAGFGTIAVIADPLIDYRQHASNVYGFKERTLLERLKAKLSEEQPRVERVKWLADVAAHRLRVLEEHGAGRPDFRAPIGHWRGIHARCVARQELVCAPSVARRGGLFLRNALSGTYGVRRGGLGYRRGLEDAIMGVFGVKL